MNLFQRFKRYLIGVAIGVILTGIFFKDRLGAFTSWLPENVVLNSIKSSDIKWTDIAKCQKEDYSISQDDFELLLEDGDVIFNESQVKTKPYEYKIESPDEQYKYIIRLDLTTSTVIQITGKSESNCK